MRTRHLGSMAGVILAAAMMAAPMVDTPHEDHRTKSKPEPKPKYKAPRRNDEMHIKAAAEKRARKAAKLREIQERNIPAPSDLMSGEVG